MNAIERTQPYEDMPDFGMDAFGMHENFDINAAFQEAVQGIVSDAELALEEKVRRMEVIVSEGTNDLYRDFVDFSMMARQIDMMCSHDHAFGQSLQNSETLSGFMSNYKSDDGHNHSEELHSKHNRKDDDEYEIDPKTGKKTKKKKRRGWFNLLVQS